MDLVLNDLQRLICHKTQPTIHKIYLNENQNIFNSFNKHFALLVGLRIHQLHFLKWDKTVG